MTFKFPFSRFEVRDKSMEPAFFEGDRVLTFNWKKLKVGDVVVFLVNRHPGGNVVTDGIFSLDSIASLQNDQVEKSYKYLIKRVDSLGKNRIFVSGDNKYLTSKISPIKYDQIIGIVIWKY